MSLSKIIRLKVNTMQLLKNVLYFFYMRFLYESNPTRFQINTSWLLHLSRIIVLAIFVSYHVQYTHQGFSCLAIQLKDPRFLVLSGAKKNFAQLSLRNCLKAGQIIENSTYNFYIKM